MQFTFKQQLIFYFFLFGFIVALTSSILIYNINKEVQVNKYNVDIETINKELLSREKDDKDIFRLSFNNTITTILKGLFATFLLSLPFIYFVTRGLNRIKKDYEDELIELNHNLKESNQELMSKTIEIANSSMKVNYLNRTLEKRIKDEVLKNNLQNEQIQQQSRLTQMGEIISMIAHQWRQPLTAINATTNNLIFKLMLDDIDKKEFENELNLISDYSQHLSKTIDDFRGFFKEDKNKEVTSLSKIVNETLDIIKISLENKNIKIIESLCCNLSLETYPSEVKQVLLNLIKNAEDVLLVKEVKNPTITIETLCSRDNNIILVVKDNGGGIPLDIIDKIFDPYFSTKKEKDGTGLGLYMSKIIIEEHCGGKMDISNDDDGAIFKISFKIINKESA